MPRQPSPVYEFARWLVPRVVRRLVTLDLRGLEHVPREGPLIFAANHVSYFDPLCLGTFVDAAGREARFLAKAELFRPVIGGLLRAAGQIPVYRESTNARMALHEAIAAINDGAAVVIYPEGTTTRNADFSPMRAKSGVVRLAVLTGAPVVPVGIWGAHLLFSRNRYGPWRRGIRVVVSAGPPVDLATPPDAPVAEVTGARDQVMAAIGAQVEAAREGWTPPVWFPAWEVRHPGGTARQRLAALARRGRHR